MSGPDGYEERTHEADEHYADVMEELDLDEMRADEERHDAAINRIPVRCQVNGHEFQMYRGLHFCRTCGLEEGDEV